MDRIDFTKFLIYRWRYWIGYGIIIVLFSSLLLYSGLFVPGGISATEKQTAIESANIHFNSISSLAVTNLPYLLLQRASFVLFGVSDFSIKLPSLFLALVSAIGLVLLLRRWFRPNVAVLASLLAVTTGQFLFVAQEGTPSILYILWSIWLLLIGTLVAKRTRPRLLWKVAFFIVVALSLYTPLSIYALIALILAVILHPHLRFIVRQLSRPKLLAAFAIALVIVSPLLIQLIRTPTLLLTLLGVPTRWPNIGANFVALLKQYFNFAGQSSSALIVPVFGLGSMLLILMGLYTIIRTRATTQSYLIIIWLICLIPVLLLNPKFTSVTFLPLVLLLATGLRSLIYYWYDLFPRNPYARIAGLIPLVILVFALVVSGLDRYMYDYYYSPPTQNNFSNDLRLIPRKTSLLIVSQQELPFYQIVDKYNKTLSVSTTAPVDPQSFVATHDANNNLVFPGYTVGQIVTNRHSTDADRLYIYKKNPF